MDFMNSTLFSLWAVGLGALCISLGFMVKSQAGMLKLQADMLSALGELTKIIAQGNIQTMPMNNWRELPPDAQLMMRNSLIEIIREMDSEMAPAGQREAPRRH